MLTILDTSVLIESGDFAAGYPTAISAVSIAELEFGVLAAGDAVVRARRLARLTEVLQVYRPLPVDAQIARSYAVLAAITSRAGRKPRSRSFDLLIAATAHAHGAQLATRNAQDFVHLSDALDIVTL